MSQLQYNELILNYCTIDSPCHYCKKRHAECHSTCEDYAKFKVESEKARKEENDRTIKKGLWRTDNGR